MSDQPRILDGKRVLVVGGGGLLGRSVCEAVVGAGALCAIADSSRSRADAAADAVQTAFGDRPAVIEASIGEERSVESMIARADVAMGGIDGLVNAAYPRNANYGRKFEDVTYADFCENVGVHLGGYFLVSQRILGYFKERGGGSLVNVASVYGVIPPRFEIYAGTEMTMPVEYAAIKSALIHLAKYMAKYYAGSGIRSNCVSLGGLANGQPDSFLRSYREHCLDKGMLDPRDAVGAIVFLLSDASMYVNGQNLVVDDGFTL